MNRLVFMSILSSVSMFNKVYGASDMNVSNYNYGCQKYGAESVEAIYKNGSVILEATQVLRSVFVNGSLRANGASMNTLEVNGGVELNNCLVSNATIVNGSLNAQSTEFQGEVSVASQKTIFKSCTVSSLVLREVDGYTGTQIIDLRDGTKVIGSVVVCGGNGEIWLSQDSTVSLNDVSGARVYQK